MTVHEHPSGTPSPDGRDPNPFLIDGCPRCDEYVEMLGRHFDAPRFRAFWDKMIRVEWLHIEAYASDLDAALGHKLYLVSLSFEHAFGIDPSRLGEHGAMLTGATDPYETRD